MPKEEWGVKRVCPNCSTRFYDLQNDPMTCPACGHEFSLESLTGNKSRSIQADKPDAQSAKTEVVDDEDVILDDEAEGDDADVDLDDDLLDDDDEDDTVSLEEIADVSGEENED